MRLFILFFISIFSLKLLSQVSLDYLESLPEEIKNEFIQQESNNDKKIDIEDNLSDQNETKQNPHYSEEEFFFGYNFFKKQSETNTPILDVPLQSEYILSFNDELELLLTGNKNDLIKLRIDLAGNVLIPEVGSLSLINLDLNEANNKISRLIKQYYVGTDSSLSVSNPSLKKISVIGAVKSPGTFLMNPFISLSEAIKYSGGLTENSSIRSIKVVSSNDETSEYDLYNFLIYGKRDEDINLRNGDTIIVSATSNFVEVKGQVLRPLIYEYKNRDTYQDIINFAQGFSLKANISSIFVNQLESNTITTISPKASDRIGKSKILDIFIGSMAEVDKKGLLVTGSSVSEGYFDFKEDQLLLEIINKLSFSSDIYPFYAILKQNEKSGLKRDFYSFSLADLSTYQDIRLKENPEIRFFNREDIEKINMMEEDIPDFYQDYILKMNDYINQSDILQINLGNQSISTPLAGKFSPSALFEYFGPNINVDKSKSSVTGTLGAIVGGFDSMYDASKVDIVSFPLVAKEKFSVEIEGNVTNPGTYIVNSGISLNDLYDIAGGVLKESTISAVFFSRESVKERERIALNNAARLLKDATISQLSNPVSSSSLGNVDYASILALTTNVEVSGRIAGDFRPNSFDAKNLFLEEGDYVYVPSTLTTVTVTGEVLNPLTISYKENSELSAYLKMAGGITEYADKGSIYIIKANGESIPYNSNIFTAKTYIEPGDTIVIPRDLGKVDSISAITVATRILSDIAFAAASLNAIQN